MAVSNSTPTSFRIGRPELTNRSVAELYEHAIRQREGLLAADGPLVVTTGKHTGRSPQDKFLVDEPGSHDKVWWGGFNQPISSRDPTSHAEVVAIRDAAARVGNYRLTGATLCVTIEPCLMCVGALVHARIGTLIYGAAEPRSGAIVSAVRGAGLPGLNHQFETIAGVREGECRALLQTFFKARR